MYARINIPLITPITTLVIPEAALISKRDRHGIVYTIEGNILYEREVTLGRTFGNDREILSGLERGEVIVLRPDAALKGGTYVSVYN
jgi:multidrug efflux pump subunit AcrA (membrane-fusion protein)